MGLHVAAVLVSAAMHAESTVELQMPTSAASRHAVSEGSSAHVSHADAVHVSCFGTVTAQSGRPIASAAHEPMFTMSDASPAGMSAEMGVVAGTSPGSGPRTHRMQSGFDAENASHEAADAPGPKHAVKSACTSAWVQTFWPKVGAVPCRANAAVSS